MSRREPRGGPVPEWPEEPGRGQPQPYGESRSYGDPQAYGQTRSYETPGRDGQGAHGYDGQPGPAFGYEPTQRVGQQQYAAPGQY
ncbi:MAG TPA: hypothetical protein VGD91_17080, partial [Trebonia sp.]